MLVLQNGDGKGAGEVASAQAELDGIAVAAISAGTPFSTTLVQLHAHSQLSVSVSGPGAVRVAVAPFAEPPCALAELSVTRETGAPHVVSQTFVRPDAHALGVLVVSAVGPTGTHADVMLNGVRLLKMGTADVPVVRTITLQQANELSLRAVGKPNGRIRAVIFDADTMPPSVAMSAPIDRLVSAASSVRAEGVVDADAVSVEVSGVVATLASGQFSADIPLAGEGRFALVATARDFCGNVARDCREVVRDTVSPVVAVSGVEDGAVEGAPVTLTFSASDEHLELVEATLDGLPFLSGETVFAEGDHELVVVAEDAAGLVTEARVRFSLDFTPPQIAVAGIHEGLVTNEPVVHPAFDATDLHLDRVEAALDGQPFESGTAVSAEGEHELRVEATDLAGNQTTVSVAFALDFEPPSIVIAGIAEGEHRSSATVLSFSSSDAHPQSLEATLDGAPFASGSTVSVEGTHELVVVAIDAAGNTAEERRVFTLDYTPPAISISGVSDGQL
ncbi:MAG TPA: hypothetical protein DFS52_03530, partial [Myxococcales bacterium]|nr:hypothetical protein [Myxococcales bacterium]